MAAFAPPALGSTLFRSSHLPLSCAPRRLRCAVRAPRAQLSGVPAGMPLKEDAHDMLLAQLMFSDPESLPQIIAARSQEIDNSFFEFIDAKVAASADIAERESLRLLKVAVQDLQKNVPTSGRNAPDVKPAAEEDAYDELIDSLVEARGREDGLRAAVLLQYPRIDLRLLERLETRSESASGEEKEALQDVLAAITKEMQVRVDAAASRLREVLGDTSGMDGMKRRVDKFAKDGMLDDAFVLLLQKNFENAVQNKAEPAIEVLGTLLKYTTEAGERSLPAELQLVRKLLRADGPLERQSLLMAAFEKRGSVALAGGGMSSGVRVDGKKFVTALRTLIEQYGNMDEKFVHKLSTIGEESEAVARKIYGMEDKDVRDLQDEAFHKRTVSVWDLEKVEISEEVEGRKAGWEGKLGEIPSGFNEDKKMII